MEERKRKYRIIKKKQEDGKKSLENKGKTKLWRNRKTQKKDGVTLKVSERGFKSNYEKIEDVARFAREDLIGPVTSTTCKISVVFISLIINVYILLYF